MPGAISLTTYTTFARLSLKEKEIHRFPHFIFREENEAREAKNDGVSFAGKY